MTGQQGGSSAAAVLLLLLLLLLLPLLPPKKNKIKKGQEARARSERGVEEASEGGGRAGLMGAGGHASGY